MAEKYPIVSSDPSVQAFYEDMRGRGESHSIAEMCAAQRGPSYLGSEQSLLRGVHNNQNLVHCTPDGAEYRIRQAKKMGVSTQGKIYAPELARLGHPNDPEAWISGRDDFERVCRKRGIAAPKMGIKAPQYVPEKVAPRLAEKHVKTLMADRLQKMEPTQRANTDLRELREAVLDKHGAKEDFVYTEIV